MTFVLPFLLADGPTEHEVFEARKKLYPDLLKHIDPARRDFALSVIATDYFVHGERAPEQPQDDYSG